MKAKSSWAKWQIALFCIFLTWFLAINLFLAWQESQTIDEAAHITAGYSYITTRDFRLNPEHPPLLKELSAAPLVALNTKDVRSLAAWDNGGEWKAGTEFVYHSKSSPRSIIFTARLAPILVAMAVGVLIFILATFLANRSYGLVALGLYYLDPNIIAHSHLVTTDIASALGFLLVFGALFLYIQKPSLKLLGVVGLTLGIALGLKYSTLLTLPFVFALVGFSVFYFEKSKSFWPNIFSFIKKLLFIGLIAILFIFAIYGFEVVRPGDSAALSGGLASESSIFRHLQNIYIPLYSYLRGLGQVLIHSQSSGVDRPVYLLGNYSTGYWYYFFDAYFIKTPLVIILAVFGGAIIGINRLIKLIKTRARLTKKTLYILTLCSFVLVYLAASTVTRINIGWRHILPVYPVLFILVAVATYSLSLRFKNKSKVYLLTVIILLGGTAISLIGQLPYLMSYSNELLPVVNKSNNWPRLTDSNLDWGQDVYRLINYAKDNPAKQFEYQLFTNAEIGRLNTPINLAQNNNFDTKKCKATVPVVLAVSYQIIYNDFGSDTYNCLRGKKPDSVIGSSILIFN